MNTLQKTAGAILSLSLLCGMQVYAFPDYPSLRGQIIEQSDICQGVVKDANGESIIGASVLVKGTTNGSITGLDGDFSLRNVKKRGYNCCFLCRLSEPGNSLDRWPVKHRFEGRCRSA